MDKEKEKAEMNPMMQQNHFFTTICSNTHCLKGDGVVDAHQPFLMSFFKTSFYPQNPRIITKKKNHFAIKNLIFKGNRIITL
jgi:hypothetical protein